MADSRIRVELSAGYTVLQNDAIRDPRLTFKARGLLAYMLSLPPEWNFSVSGLAKLNRDGKDAIRSALSELEEAGYLVREGQSHGERGHFANYNYVLYDVSRRTVAEKPTRTEEEGAPTGEDGEFTVSGNPTPSPPWSGFPQTVNPSTDNPSTENPTQINKYQVNTYQVNTPLPPKGGAGEKDKLKLDAETRDMLNKYCSHDPELGDALVSLMEVRAKLKAVNSFRAVRSLIQELERLSAGDREARVLIVRQSVANSWKSVFPLRGGAGRAGPARRQEEVADW